uniref:Mitochondrial import inner membrane translocase subunit TIM44 n=1 Tax=Sinocyclocheilus rhinocerous TaxID=307959 RepID=A0A673KA48_9TELE
MFCGASAPMHPPPAHGPMHSQHGALQQQQPSCIHIENAQNARFMSSGGSRKGFLGEFLDNLKQELSKNKEMKENIQKFREEARKLEESEALKQARRKYQTIESETVKTSEVLKKTLGTISETVKEVSVITAGFWVFQHILTCRFGRGRPFGQIGPYRPPSRLRKRSDFSSKAGGTEAKVFEANEEAMGVVLHKDSKWYQQWKDFKDNNVVFNRFFEMKMKYDESENAFIRASRAVTDKMTDIIGGLFSKTEMSEVLTEILKVDPNFDKDSFLKQCERDIIPNILEAMIQGELEVLKDWCYEATYSRLAHPVQQAKAMGLQFHSKILDIDNIDLAMGKKMEQGPVLIITFQAQLVMVIRNVKGEAVEGDPEKVLRMMYVWALCRDQDELNPYAAWRLLDISASSTEQIL